MFEEYPFWPACTKRVFISFLAGNRNYLIFHFKAIKYDSARQDFRRALSLQKGVLLLRFPQTSAEEAFPQFLAMEGDQGIQVALARYRFVH